jgi:hypothetical protein
MLSFKAEFEPGMPTAAAPMIRQTIFLTMSPQAGTTYCSSRIGHTAVHVQLIGASGLTAYWSVEVNCHRNLRAVTGT